LKKSGIILSSLMMLIFSFIIFSQEKDIREDVVVVNVEVPVRVMFKGKPVDNLKKSDFRLFENGKELQINGFNIIRKKISSQKIDLDSERKQFYNPRFFVLAFSVTNFNRFYKKGVRYFFDNVLKETDKLLVLINNTTRSYNDLKDKAKIQNSILNILNEEGKKARINMRKSLLIVEGGIRNLISRLNSLSRRGAREVGESEVLSFFAQYQGEWETYKRNFLTLNIYTMYNFASYLKRINLEKWVISFYQYEKFPVLDFNSYGSKLIRYFMGRESRRIYGEVNREFNAFRTFPYSEVSKIFYNLGATFNLIVIPTRIETDSEDTKTADISTAIEITLREIAKRTGGTVLFSTNLVKSLDKIVQREDIQYLLTYAPKDNQRIGKLKIKLKEKKYSLLYDNNKRADFIKRQLKEQAKKEKIIKLLNLEFQNKKLVFRLVNFRRKRNKDVMEGRLSVNLIVKNLKGEIIFDKNKNLMPKKEFTDIAISFKWLEVGRYDLLIDIKDLISKRTAFEYLKLNVK